MVDRNNLLEELYRRVDDKLDDLSTEVKNNHKEITDKLQHLELQVSSHQEKIGLAKWVFNGSGLLGFVLAIVALCKDFLNVPHK